MSRNLNRSGCGFFMGLMAGAFLMTSTLAAQETTAKHPAPAPAIPGVQALNDHPFSSLLDDVTIEPQPYANGYFSFVAQCQLNAPLDSAAVTNANSAQSETEATWAQLMTYTCNDKNCNNSNLTFTNSPSSNLSPNCNTHSCTDESAQSKSEDFCEQISQLLATTLDGTQASFEAKSEAIETAMQMVAEKTRANAELEFSEIKKAHQNQIDQLQEQLLELKNQGESLDLVLSWLRPIYANQNRNYQQLQQLAQSKTQPNPYHLSLVKPLGKKPTFNFDRSLIPSSAQMASKSLADKREAEIAKLKQELKKIDSRLSELVNQSENQRVQTATHLQPVYVPNEQLAPILNVPERHSAAQNLDSTQQLNRNR